MGDVELCNTEGVISYHGWPVHAHCDRPKGHDGAHGACIQEPGVRDFFDGQRVKSEDYRAE